MNQSKTERMLLDHEERLKKLEATQEIPIELQNAFFKGKKVIPPIEKPETITIPKENEELKSNVTTNQNNDSSPDNLTE